MSYDYSINKEGKMASCKKKIAMAFEIFNKYFATDKIGQRWMMNKR
jgi:hypothetical protein